MSGIKIGDKEYTEDEALELVQKGEDYTKKTMDLAEQKKALDGETEYMKTLRGMDQYANTHPEFKSKMEAIIEEERAISEGRPYTPQGNDDGDQGANSEEEYVSKTELKNILKQDREDRQAEDNKKSVQTQVFSDMEVLRKRGYTKEELTKIGATASQSNRFPLEIAERMAFRDEIPNRFLEKKKEENESDEEKLKLLKGKPGSGHEMSTDEKEFIQSGGDPGEMLKQRLAKTPGLLITKE